MTDQFGGYYVGDGDFDPSRVTCVKPVFPCPRGFEWNDASCKCISIIPSPPPMAGFWPYFPPPHYDQEAPEVTGFWPFFPPPHVEEMGCDDCDTVVSGDPCAGEERGGITSAFLNPIGAALSAQQMKECRERRMHREHQHRHHHHRMGHMVGFDGEWEPWRQAEHRHHHHHRPWWERGEESQFYVGATPAGDPVKAPAHPAVQDTTAQATTHPVTQVATTQASQAPGATPAHVSDVSQAATHSLGATAAATTAAQAAPQATHPEVALKAAAAATDAATHARTATTAAATPQAPGTKAARAARTSAAHASRAASHAHAAVEARSRGAAEHHERAAQSHGRAAAAHARMAHGEAGRGRGAEGLRADWMHRPEFADYERRYGARWFERPEFNEFRWRYGGEWWRRPEFVDYERTYGAEWWLRPEFASYAQRYLVEEEEPTPTVVQVPVAADSGQAVCILPGEDGQCLKEMVTTASGVFYRVTSAGAAAGVQLDQDELARNAALGGGGGEVGDEEVSGNFAGWGHGGSDLFTDLYGRFDPRLPPAWSTNYMYYPDYYEGVDPRVGIQSGPAIVGVQSGPAIVGVQSGPAIVGMMAGKSRGMHGGFYHSSPEIEGQAAEEQIEAMYPSFGGGMDGMPGTYPGYGFGGWGNWGHGF